MKVSFHSALITGSSRGVRRYFSKKEWRARDAAEAALKAGFTLRDP